MPATSRTQRATARTRRATGRARRATSRTRREASRTHRATGRTRRATSRTRREASHQAPTSCAFPLSTGRSPGHAQTLCTQLRGLARTGALAGTAFHHLRGVGNRHGEDFRADPAHRLDRETSGLLVCARTLEASQRLFRAFHDGLVEKQYLAVVEGHPAEDELAVDAPIAFGTELIRIAVRIDRAVGRPARTRFRVVKRFAREGEKFALVRAYPETGRQHQIRIHAQVAGFPLVGDKMYGPDPGYFDRFSKKCLEPEAWERLRLPRHALHAAFIAFEHPGTG
ncbi:MAG: RluA family pseudouridine synthase, partial [Deltaproteobacteria bacterium]|nr:RluA family pseudouridine synthase [Deltaproteobacteria bacterium]